MSEDGVPLVVRAVGCDRAAELFLEAAVPRRLASVVAIKREKQSRDPHRAKIAHRLRPDLHSAENLPIV